MENSIIINSEKSKCLIACFITMLAVSSVFMTQSIFLEISESFRIDIAQARFAFSIVSLFYAVSFFLIGPVVDKFPLPTVAVAGLSSLSISVFAASCINDFGIFVFIMAIVGLSATLIPASMFPYVSTTAPSNKVGLYVGAIVASATLGVILGRVLIGVLTSFAGWKFSFRIFSLLLIISTILTFAFLVRNQKEERQKLKIEAIFQAYKYSVRLIFSSKVGVLLLAGFSLFFGFLGAITFLTYRLVEPPFNFSAGEVGWISFAGLTAIIAPFSGSLSQKIGIYKIIMPSLITCLLALQLMGWFDSVFFTVIGLLFLFLGVYSCQPLIFLLIGENISKQLIGSASSLYILFCIGGGSLSSIILGSVWHNFGWAGITIVCSASIFIALLLIITTQIRNKIF